MRAKKAGNLRQREQEKGLIGRKAVPLTLSPGPMSTSEQLSRLSLLTVSFPYLTCPRGGLLSHTLKKSNLE